MWSNVINVIVMAYLARSLSKEDFGLLAISSVFIGIINTVATSGISEYLIYYDGDSPDRALNSAFWLNLLLTVAVVLVVVIAGPHWAVFYGDPKISALSLFLAGTFFFEMNSTVPKAILRKELDYGAIVYLSSISMTLSSIGKVAAAWFGFGVYSLVLPQLIVSPFLMTAIFLRARWKPLASFRYVHFKPIIDYSKHVIGGRLLTKLVNEGDNLIIGKFVGLEGLGVYALAFQLANLVTSNLVVIVSDVFMPVFSKVKGDLERLQNIFCKMIQALSFMSFPLIAVLAVSAEPIVRAIYGDGWYATVLPFQILSIFALGRAISSPSSALFNAMGKPEKGFTFVLWFTPVFLTSVYFGSYFDVVGVAVATTASRFVGSGVLIGIALRTIGLSWKKTLNDIGSIVICTLLTVAALSVSLLEVFHMNALTWMLLRLSLIPGALILFFLLMRWLYPTTLAGLTQGLATLSGNWVFIQLVTRIAPKA